MKDHESDADEVAHINKIIKESIKINDFNIKKECLKPNFEAA